MTEKHDMICILKGFGGERDADFCHLSKGMRAGGHETPLNDSGLTHISLHAVATIGCLHCFH